MTGQSAWRYLTGASSLQSANMVSCGLATLRAMIMGARPELGRTYVLPPRRGSAVTLMKDLAPSRERTLLI